MRINQGIQDGDIVFRGNDGGSIITALTIDMSDAGKATFNAGASFSNNVGIGITPAAELHVNETNAGGLGGRVLIQNNSSTSGTFCQLIMAPTAATAATRCVVIQAENTDGNNNQAIVFKTSAGGSPAERVRIDSSGNLLVGQASLNYNAAGASMGSGGL